MYAHLFGWVPSLWDSTRPVFYLALSLVLALDLYLNTRWQFELHKSVDCLWS